MEYCMLKLELDNALWEKKYVTDVLRVRSEKDVPQVDDDYADDMNFGQYTGDDDRAYYHAYGTYLELKELLQKEQSEEDATQIAELRNIFLDDLFNYILAGYMININRSRLTKLMKMAGQVCCTEEIISFVRKRCEREAEYRKERRYDDANDLAANLDFRDIYMAMGDKMLFLEHNLDRAMEFYQLALLEWKEDEEEKKTVMAIQRQIMDYKHIRDKKHYKLNFQTDSPVLKNLYQQYGAFYKVFRNSLSEVEKLIDPAENFAATCQKILDNSFKAKAEEEEYRIESKEDLRLCYMMALQLYQDAFLWGVFYLLQDTEAESTAYKEDIIRGLGFISSEYLRPVKEFYFGKSKQNSILKYRTVLVLLEAIAYVELIRDALREKNLKQNIAYYTSLNTLRYLLPDRAKDEEQAKETAGRMAIMHVAYMNDPNEGKTLWNFCGGKELSGITNGERRSVEYPFVFLKCFTPLIDDLPMWEMYGDRAEGCCIVFRNSFFKNTNQQVPLYRVCYLRKRNSSYEFCAEDNQGVENSELLDSYLVGLKELYQEQQNKAQIKKYFRKITEPIMFLFKDANYQHEQELRIMYRYAGSSKEFRHVPGEYPKLYVNPELYVRMKEIILGPKVQNIPVIVPYLMEELQKLSQLRGVECPVISASGIEYQ